LTKWHEAKTSSMHPTTSNSLPGETARFFGAFAKYP
jgi:hypothetical protein